MKTIVVLSGKGGVGKSSITASLATTLAKHKKIVSADCDVDASNLSLLFSIRPERYERWEPISTNKAARVNLEKCVGCGVCADACYFDAIKIAKGHAVVSESGCEGCGACRIVCRHDAIRLEDVNNAHIGYADSGRGFAIVSAQLMPGSSGSGKVVAEVRKLAASIGKDAKIMLIDAAAGIGCPVIASVTGADLALIVTEPTPSGHSDMMRAISIARHFRVRCGIIINKHDVNAGFTAKIESFAGDNGIEVIEKIPFDPAFARAMVQMRPIVEMEESYKAMFENIAKKAIGL